MQHIHERTSGHNRDQRRPKHSWVLPSSGQAPHRDGKFIMWKVSCFSFLFFTLNSLPIFQLKQSWISTSEVDDATHSPTIKMYICCSLKTNLKQTETTLRLWANSNSWIFCGTSNPRWTTQNKNFKASISCISLQRNMLHLLRWLYGAAGKSSWLLLSTPAERVKLIHGDVWWVIALSTRPLVLLSGLVWSFIYTPFCSGFSGQFSQLFTVNKLQSKAPISGRHVE